MPPEKLVRMANQIATFFHSQPRLDRVVAVAGHLHDYWEPRMVQALAAHVRSGPQGLDPLARAALVHLGHLDEPASS